MNKVFPTNKVKDRVSQNKKTDILSALLIFLLSGIITFGLWIILNDFINVVNVTLKVCEGEI